MNDLQLQFRMVRMERVVFYVVTYLLVASARCTAILLRLVAVSRDDRASRRFRASVLCVVHVPTNPYSRADNHWRTQGGLQPLLGSKNV